MSGQSRLFTWIDAFLNNRSQVINAFLPFHLFIAVCLKVLYYKRPILFLTFINDLESICCGESNIMLLADYAKLYNRVQINHPSTLHSSNLLVVYPAELIVGI